MKFSLTFLAGIPLGIGIKHFAGINSGAPMFFAGVLAVVIPVIALLSSKRRVRTLARFLNAVATSDSGIATGVRFLRGQFESRLRYRRRPIP